MYFQSKYRKIKKISKDIIVARKKNSQKIIFFFIVSAIAALLFAGHYALNTPSIFQKLFKDSGSAKFRILIDAGHYKGSLNGTQYKTRLEYKVNYILAKKITDLLKKKKPNWFIELSRGENYYTDKVLEYQKKHFKEIESEAQKAFKINYKKYKYMRRWSKPVLQKWMKDRINVITVRNYAEDNFDILLSIHFNYPGIKYFSMKYRGFGIFISPKNAFPEKSRKFAEYLKAEMIKFTPISNCGQERRFKGIVSDTYALLGTDYRTVNVPAIILETEYIMHKKCDDPKFHKQVSEAVLKSMNKYYKTVFLKKQKKK